MLCRFKSYTGARPKLLVLPIALAALMTACGQQDPYLDAGYPIGAVHREAMQALPDVWAMRWSIPVSWKGNLAVAKGEGELVHYVKSTALMQDGVRTDTLRLCGVQQPAYSLRAIYGRETYQATFPVEVFDAESLPESTMVSRLGDAGAFVSDFVALELGGRLDDPGARWPDPGSAYPGKVHLQADGTPGFTSIMRTDPPFTKPPLNMLRTRRAAAFHIALRHLVAAEGAYVHDGFAEGRARVAGIGGKAALNTAVLACRAENGSGCSPAELYDLNHYSPVYKVAGPGHFVMQRVAADADCATINDMAFQP